MPREPEHRIHFYSNIMRADRFLYIISINNIICPSLIFLVVLYNKVRKMLKKKDLQITISCFSEKSQFASKIVQTYSMLPNSPTVTFSKHALRF